MQWWIGRKFPPALLKNKILDNAGQYFPFIFLHHMPCIFYGCMGFMLGAFGPLLEYFFPTRR